MIKLIREWFIKIAIFYQKHTQQNKKLTRCAECKRLYMFDVPSGTIIEDVDFICGKCVKK